VEGDPVAQRPKLIMPKFKPGAHLYEYQPYNYNNGMPLLQFVDGKPIPVSNPQEHISNLLGLDAAAFHTTTVTAHLKDAKVTPTP